MFKIDFWLGRFPRPLASGAIGRARSTARSDRAVVCKRVLNEGRYRSWLQNCPQQAIRSAPAGPEIRRVAGTSSELPVFACFSLVVDLTIPFGKEPFHRKHRRAWHRVPRSLPGA